ncbi:TIGR04076 family protein [Candidatus Bipolaricaulota bacterium]|jgi:uncharacterized repeat protein (TIGR04076 family)|nr:TIGR04076 family protein [Candidatus Bipolaricaulota bacterium]TFH10683.1 MAG: TIGR04076 family protein [Candidatus Atribacteria bacterium]
MVKAEIRVLQVIVFEDLVKKTLPQDVWEHVVPCEFFKTGQSFTVDATSEMPEGFCSSAWFDLRDKLAACLRDEDPLTPLIVCCQDGLRPVTFRIERLED